MENEMTHTLDDAKSTIDELLVEPNTEPNDIEFIKNEIRKYQFLLKSN